MIQTIHKQNGKVFYELTPAMTGVEQLIAKAPEGAKARVNVTTTTAFDSTTAVVAVGHTGAKTIFMDGVDVKPIGGKDSAYTHEAAENERGIYVTLTAAASTVGRALVTVEFVFPTSQETEH